MRDKKKRKDGMQYLNVTYPKFKYGDEVVREVSVDPTYGRPSKFFNFSVGNASKKYTFLYFLSWE